jgi:lysozyme
MNVSPFALRMIRSFETFEPVAYHDMVGVLTIGYGHAIKPGEVFPHTITREFAEGLLMRDCEEKMAGIVRVLAVRLREFEMDAVLSFAFNLGISALEGSTLLRKLNAGDTFGAAREFRRWHYAGKPPKPVRGLLRRRIFEELRFLGGHEESVMDCIERMRWL